MPKLKSLHIKELLICLACFAVPIIFGLLHVQHFEYIETLFAEEKLENAIDTRTIHHGVSTVKYNELLWDIAGGDYYIKRFDMPNGDTVISGSLRGETNEAVVLETLEMGPEARIHILDNGVATNEELKEGKYDASLIIIDSDSFDIACYTPKQYKFLEKESLEYLPENDGYIDVKKNSKGFEIKIVSLTLGENCCSDFMLVYSESNLVDWELADADPENEWLAYTMDGANRWTYNGYYRLADLSYIPSGDNIYSKCMACYIGKSFGGANNRYLLMDDMLCCILETMADQQNEEGFFPSNSDSTRLISDHNMHAPYYDTRFNSDLMESFIQGYKLYGNTTSYRAMEEYLEFFTAYVEEYGRDDGKGGIYVPDYYEAGADIDSVVASLNHQLSELIVLYKMHSIFGDDELKALADKMLLAITNSGDKWIKEDGSYHYAIYPDGHYGGIDYDALTYNDFFRLQLLLEKQYGQRNAKVDQMMKPKLEQMQRNNIKGYSK